MNTTQPRRYPNTTCDLCGAPIYRRPSTLQINAGKYCSRACRNRAHPNHGPRKPLPHRRGANNPAWKGGVTYFRKHGNYKPIKYVRCPLDLLMMARKDGYVMEHRLLMARMAGYPLLRAEVVHHIDHDPQNNSLDNLELWPTNKAHKLAEHGRFVPGAACRWFPTD
jgi:hypothetical protein